MAESMDRLTQRRQFAVEKAIQIAQAGLMSRHVLDIAADIEDYLAYGSKRP